MKRFYILRNDRPDILERIEAQLRACYRDAGEFDVSIVPHVEKRSLQANRYYWGVVIPEITLEADGHSRDEIHELLMLKFAPREGMTDLDGQPAERLIRTSAMNRNQFGEYLERVIAWAAENGVVISDPNPMLDYWTEVA